MGSRLFDEIREKRGLCYSVYALDHAFADVPILQLGSGLDSSKCVEAYARMREIVDELRDEGPTEEEVERARAYAAGRLRAGLRELGRGRPLRGHPADRLRRGASTPTRAIAALDAVTYDEVREVAAGRRRQARRRLRRAAHGRGVLSGGPPLADRDHAVDRDARALGQLARDAHLETHLRQGVAQLGECDHLHETAGCLGVGRR